MARYFINISMEVTEETTLYDRITDLISKGIPRECIAVSRKLNVLPIHEQIKRERNPSRRAALRMIDRLKSNIDD